MQSLQTPAPAAPRRDPITTHVLDSTTGRPAAAVKATLTLLASPHGSNPTWTATTSATDGRVNTWSGGADLNDLVMNLAAKQQTTAWSLRFDTAEYWGGDKTFYPEVEIKFFLKPEGGHYHVPLLLGPWGYTTYRGS